MKTNAHASKVNKPFGTWSSPFSAASIAEAKKLSEVYWDTDGKTLVWLEGRSDQNVLVCRREKDAMLDLTSSVNVRAEVWYGGGDFTVHQGNVYFVAAKTGRIFKQRLRGGPARAITPAFGKVGSPTVSPDGKWLVYVHSDEDGNDRIAVVDTDGVYWPQILSSGHDYYMQPRFSPDGKSLAFVAGDQPRMAWDGTEVWVGRFGADASGLPVLTELRSVAGGDSVATAQPEFSADSASIFYMSDESGWNHIWQLNLTSNRKTQITRGDVEYGIPTWRQGVRCFALGFEGQEEKIYAIRNDRGFMQVESVDLATQSITPISTLDCYTSVTQICSDGHGKLAFIGASAMIPPRVVMWDSKLGSAEIVARSSAESIEIEYISKPEPVIHPTGALSGLAGGTEVAYGLFFPPAHPRYTADGKPPLVVLVHGGPTSQVTATWNPGVQFFTSRGFAVFQTNYRGSTGYGREYMLKLRGQWGVCDVEDSIHAKRFLQNAGRIDGSRTVIMGGSAGGFTVLQAMVNAPEEFTAGINLYGLSNLFTSTDTHKFESCYNDLLLGALPEASQVWRERSPVFHADRIKRPLAVFQGEEDEVVKKDQSDEIVEALKKNKTPYIYHVYPGEGHGWRKRETILHFYGELEKFVRQYVVFS